MLVDQPEHETGVVHSVSSRPTRTRESEVHKVSAGDKPEQETGDVHTMLVDKPEQETGVVHTMSAVGQPEQESGVTVNCISVVCSECALEALSMQGCGRAC